MKLSTLLEAAKKKAKTPAKAKVAPKPEKKITINETTLRKIAEECRAKIIGSGQAKFGDCESVSFAIAKALSRLVKDIKVVDGNWAGTISTKASARGHVWCYIPSMNLIIDATQDQFNAGTKIIITEWNPNDPDNDSPCERGDKNCIKYRKLDFYADHLLKGYFNDPEFKDIEVL